MSNAEYAFMSAYLKGAEAKTVTREHVDRMSRTTALSDIMEAIRGTEISSYLEATSIKSFADFDQSLWQYFGQCLERLEGLKLMPAAMRGILNSYRLKYDIINVKSVLQSIRSGKSARLIPVGVIHNRGLLDELSRADGADTLARLLLECGLGAYAAILREYDSGSEAKLRLQTEARMDGEYYKDLLETSKDIEDGFILARIIGLMVDLTNLKIASRAAIEETGTATSDCIIEGGYLLSHQTIEGMISGKLNDIPSSLGGTQYRNMAEEVVASYNKTGSITAIEEVIDRYRMEMLKEILSPRVMSPLVVIWYLTIKEMELKNLRMVLKAVFDGISVDEIKEYLVF
ncbi:MAG: V-type ATPase subunit [Dehalococcoidales bacterium]